MIRFASENDIQDIMNFINIYWKRGHILGNNEAFFRYEHCIENEVTYVISQERDSQINAILGYIPYGKSKRDIMTVMWKANHSRDVFLGIKLLQYLIENGNIRIIASPGINKKTKGIYDYLGYTVGIMTCWYRLNRTKDIFRIAAIKENEVPHVKLEGQAKLLELRNWQDVQNLDLRIYKDARLKPYKELWYIEKRYFRHPIYHYNVFGVVNSSGILETMFVFRIQDCNGSKALRLIDCLGLINNISKVTVAIDELMLFYDAEYVDCYEAGIKEAIFLESGWKKARDSGNIIPNYFSPYVKENVDVSYFSTDSEIVLFKGDGDQDRPN